MHMKNLRNMPTYQKIGLRSTFEIARVGYTNIVKQPYWETEGSGSKSESHLEATAKVGGCVVEFEQEEGWFGEANEAYPQGGKSIGEFILDEGVGPKGEELNIEARKFVDANGDEIISPSPEQVKNYLRSDPRFAFCFNGL